LKVKNLTGEAYIITKGWDNKNYNVFVETLRRVAKNNKNPY